MGCRSRRRSLRARPYVVTHLGDTKIIIVLAIVLAIVEYIRRPNRWIVAFLVLVILGQNLLTNGIKELLDRARPTLNPIAETLGPSFPSGHSATAAAFWAAAALVLGRGRGSVGRACLAGAAAGIAVAVAAYAGASGRALVVGRDRRARPRMGVVRRVRDRVRRSLPQIRSRRGSGRGRRGRGRGPRCSDARARRQGLTSGLYRMRCGSSASAPRVSRTQSAYSA